jgi:hypothetical protein
VKLMSVEDDERVVAAEPIGESNVPDGNSLLPEGSEEEALAENGGEDLAPADSDETTNGDSSGSGEPEES